MDVLKNSAILFGILKVITAQYPQQYPDQQFASSTLKCLECDHIRANRTGINSNSPLFNFYSLLDRKFNLACALDDPFDQDELEWRTDDLRAQGVYIPPAYTGNPVGQVPCQAFSPTNKCNYVAGNLQIRLKHYNNEVVNLHIVVRNCMTVDPKIENICYDRNSAITSLVDLKDILSFFQDRLSFLGRGSVEVLAFNGRQCYCSNNLCRPYIVGGSSRTSGYSAALVFAVLVSILM